MTNAIRRRKSERLTPGELKRFKNWVAGFETKIDAAEKLNRSVVTLDNVLLRGSGRPDTISIIRQCINAA